MWHHNNLQPLTFVPKPGLMREPSAPAAEVVASRAVQRTTCN